MYDRNGSFHVDEKDIWRVLERRILRQKKDPHTRRLSELSHEKNVFSGYSNLKKCRSNCIYDQYDRRNLNRTAMAARRHRLIWVFGGSTYCKVVPRGAAHRVAKLQQSFIVWQTYYWNSKYSDTLFVYIRNALSGALDCLAKCNNRRHLQEESKDGRDCWFISSEAADFGFDLLVL